MPSKITIITIFISLFFIAGCATATGPLFKEVKTEEHKGKAIVYFFRDSIAGGAWVYDLKITSKNTLPLPNKGYHLLLLEHGNYEFEVLDSSEIHAKSSFVLQKDETYFIRYWAEKGGYKSTTILEGTLGILGGTTGPLQIINKGISLVPRDEAMEVLKKCRLIKMPRIKGR